MHFSRSLSHAGYKKNCLCKSTVSTKQKEWDFFFSPHIDAENTVWRLDLFLRVSVSLQWANRKVVTLRLAQTHDERHDCCVSAE